MGILAAVASGGWRCRLLKKPFLKAKSNLI